MRRYYFAVLVLLAGCANVGNEHGTGGTSGSKAEPEQGGSQIKLTRHEVMDTDGTGKLAGTYLLPDGYTAEDELTWVPGAYMCPVVGTSVLKSADKQIMIVSSSGSQTGFAHSPAGDQGADPPKSVSSYLLNRWRKAHPDIRVSVVSKQDSDIAEATHSGPGWRMSGRRGFLTMKYVDGDTTYLVRCHARIDVMSTTPTTTAIGGTLYEGAWVTSNVYTVIAPEDRIEEAMRIFGIVLSSYRMDPHFFNTIMQAREIIQRNFYAGVRRAGEISRIISQTNDEITASMDKTYHDNEAAQEHEITGFDDYIRGVDKYDESEGQVSLPSGYAHAWSDGNGKYIVTDQHGYDPNVGGPNGTWHEMEKSR